MIHAWSVSSLQQGGGGGSDGDAVLELCVSLYAELLLCHDTAVAYSAKAALVRLLRAPRQSSAHR